MKPSIEALGESAKQRLFDLIGKACRGEISPGALVHGARRLGLIPLEDPTPQDLIAEGRIRLPREINPHE